MKTVFAFCALLGLLGSGSGGAAGAPIKNVILMVGDGMGLASVSAARIDLQTRGLELTMDRAPRSALVHTLSADAWVSDSASTMTAMMTGIKVDNGVLSFRDGAPEATAAEWAESRGLATGVVTTTRVTHATPAAVYAHAPSRNLEEEIAVQAVPGTNPAMGDGLEVLLGGGSRYFLGSDAGGSRQDDRSLVNEMAAAGYTVVRTREELEAARDSHKLLGLFSSSHMDYEYERRRAAEPQPSLVDMTRAALHVLKQDPDGFFLMIEGGRIDHALHEGNAFRAIMETEMFDRALQVVLEETDPQETLVLVTADHDHTLVLAGYPSRDQSVFGTAGWDRAGRPYPMLVFGTGPGAVVPREYETPEGFADPDYLGPAGVDTESETHGGMDVPLYAFGPRDILEAIPGSIDNTEIFGLLINAIDSTAPPR